jgi:hypothetical protein
MNDPLEQLITPAVVATICARSSDGEGVEAIIEDLGLPKGAMEHLRDYHHGKIRAAKVDQLIKRAARLT